jgi:hypothetical protein
MTVAPVPEAPSVKPESPVSPVSPAEKPAVDVYTGAAAQQLPGAAASVAVCVAVAVAGLFL